MIRDIVDSFKDNVSQKTGNPFLATILIVWTFKNWRLLYGLLYFDKELKLKDRIAFIEEYYSTVHFHWNLFNTIWISFLVLIGTYVLLAIARIIVDTYNKIIVPKISKWTDKSSIVLKSVYIDLFKHSEELENKLSIEREARIKAKNELEGIEARFAELVLEKESVNQLRADNQLLHSKNEELLDQVNSFENGKKNNLKMEKEYKDLKSKHDSLLNRYNDLLMTSKKYEEIIIQNEETDLERERLVIDKIRSDEELLGNYLKICEQVLNDDAIDKTTQSIRYFVSLGLFQVASHVGGDYYTYSFTKLGKKAHDLIFRYIV